MPTEPRPGATSAPHATPRTNGHAIRQEPARHWRETLHHERMAHLIKDAFRCTSSSLQRRLKAYAVPYGHWTFLRILWQTDGLTQRQLSEQAGVTEPSTVSALKAMEASGTITRTKMPGNRKEVRVFLTSKGTALRSLAVPCAEEVNRIATAGIPADDLAVARRTLLAIIENLERDTAQAGDDDAGGDQERGSE